MSTEQLYVKKVSQAGKVSYQPYIRPTRVDLELTNAEVCSMVATIGICCLHGFEDHLPEHAIISRKTRALEQAIGEVCNLNRSDLSEKHLDAATQAWGAAMRTMQQVLST
ncbi:hypothetical protein [Trichlorobacter lovleyi]|uniref:hypothetical protein n=1 Tax=Trichlorobacter lovleyi TaxID=313985 RepID=UPI003D13908B